MKILTLIPNAANYGIVILFMLILGSFTIARHVHIRWLSSYWSFMASNALVKSFIVIFGLLIIPFQSLFEWNFALEGYGILVGIMLGILSIYIEMSMIRRENRKRIISKSCKSSLSDRDTIRHAILTPKMSLISKNHSAKGLKKIRQSYVQYATDMNMFDYSLASVIIVAIVEEWLFRGYAISLAKLFSNYFVSLFVIVITLLLFSASHISTSWNECKYKLPLSLFTTCGFIITGNLLTAISTHVILNSYAYLQVKKINSIRVLE